MCLYIIAGYVLWLGFIFNGMFFNGGIYWFNYNILGGSMSLIQGIVGYLHNISGFSSSLRIMLLVSGTEN